MDPKASISDALGNAFRAPASIKFGPGVLGVVMPVAAFGIVGLTIVGCFIARQPYAGLIVAGMILLLCVGVVGLSIWYAVQNPDAAVLGDAHYVEIRRQDFAAKDPTLVLETGAVPQLIEGEIVKPSSRITDA